MVEPDHQAAGDTEGTANETPAVISCVIRLDIQTVYSIHEDLNPVG